MNKQELYQNKNRVQSADFPVDSIQEELVRPTPQGNVIQRPKFKGKLDIAVWENVTKEGKPYLSLSIGGLKIPLWLNEQ
jgi:hypothetical protein